MGCHHHALLLDKNAVKLAKMSGIDFLLVVKLHLDLKQKSIPEKALNVQILITNTMFFKQNTQAGIECYNNVAH